MEMANLTFVCIYCTSVPRLDKPYQPWPSRCPRLCMKKVTPPPGVHAQECAHICGRYAAVAAVLEAYSSSAPQACKQAVLKSMGSALHALAVQHTKHV
eukprot:1160973-Pelagomonas_calceolata.AAC.2